MDTQSIKDVVSLAIGVAKLVDDTLGGISFSEVFELLGVLKEVKPAIDAVKSGQVVQEFKSLDDAAKADLIQWFDQNFQIKEANIQQTVDQAFAAIIGISDLVKSISSK